MRRLATLCAALALLSATAASATSPWTVFFETGSSELNGDAKAMLDSVAATFRTGTIPRLRLYGHTDRAGSSERNLWLARRRVTAVRDWLEYRGVPARVIELHAIGETRPMVDTSDGVRELQNRRVEIGVGCVGDPPPEHDYTRCER